MDVEPVFVFTVQGIELGGPRSLSYAEGWVELTEPSRYGEDNITVFHVSDIDEKQVKINERDDIGNGEIYQVWAGTLNGARLVVENEGEKEQNYFSIMFRDKANAEAFAYALKQLAHLGITKGKRPGPGVLPGDDFRNLSWGMTRRDVVALETGELQDASYGLVFRDEIFGYPAEIQYNFGKDGLELALCTLVGPDFQDYNDYIDFYREFASTLSKDYGKPTMVEEDWKDERYRDRPERHGFAVSIGHVIFRTRWETEKATFILGITQKSEESGVNVFFGAIKPKR